MSRPQTWDAFDFFTVSLTVSSLATTFGKSATDITWGITLVLMFRSAGSIIFGIASDRYGRKWPFIVNNLLFIVLELVCTGLLLAFVLFPLGGLWKAGRAERMTQTH
jgi:MFS family permease